jgi:N-acetylneuraminic acid mutarotase
LPADRTTFTETVERYNPTTNRWSGVASLPVALAGMAAVTGNDGKIYVIGGEDATYNDVASVEVYDTKANRWTLGTPLSATRCCLGAAVGKNGTIYAVGGIVADKISTSVETYRPGKG